MTLTLVPNLNSRKNYQSFGDIGNSPEYSQITKQSLKAKAHYQERPSIEKTIWACLMQSSDLEELENRVQNIYNKLEEGLNVLTDLDLEVFAHIIRDGSLLTVLTLARVIEPMLQSKHYQESAETLVRTLLHRKEAELRYLGLEILSSTMGTSPIADKLLLEAKELLKLEKKKYIQQYLYELLS